MSKEVIEKNLLKNRIKAIARIINTNDRVKLDGSDAADVTPLTAYLAEDIQAYCFKYLSNSNYFKYQPPRAENTDGRTLMWNNKKEKFIEKSISCKYFTLTNKRNSKVNINPKLDFDIFFLVMKDGIYLIPRQAFVTQRSNGSSLTTEARGELYLTTGGGKRILPGTDRNMRILNRNYKIKPDQFLEEIFALLQ